jgi:hypothetical protein
MQKTRTLLSAALCAVAISCSGQPQVKDLKSLIGKKATAQRMPFYQPGTYTRIPPSYAGQEVTIIDVKPSSMFAAMLTLSPAQLASLPAESRATIENAKGAAILVVQFPDGTKADTGPAPVMPSTLSTYLEVIEDNQTTTAPAALNDARRDSQTSMASGDLFSQKAEEATGKDHTVAIMDGGVGAPSATPLVASITLFMPEAVIAMKSASARSQFLKYSPSDEDRQRALMIQAHGAAGRTIQEGCTSITRVVLLSDPAGRVVKEAYYSEPATQVWKNGYGATNECDDLIVKFWLKDVEDVKSAASNREFFVAVFSGSVNVKTYKVKRKFQVKLGLN